MPATLLTCTRQEYGSENPTERCQNPRAEGGPTDISELVRVLDQCLLDLQAGQQPDRQQLIAAHPHLAPQLEQALAGLEFIHRAAQAPGGLPAQLGDFKIIRELGRGGMGVVYEAEQLSLKRRVALKVLRLGAVADEVAMQRFQREVETIARLHHTNIVPIFAVGAEQDVRYYAMQFIEGRDLAQLIKEARQSARPIAPERLANWGLQAAEALAHAHQRGVIHRDVKPSNLILDPDGRIWLTDFGLARRMDDVTLSVAGALLGTPRYMSPEQARAATTPVDHRTDIYSLGATLYELATRQPIFDAATPHEVITQVLNQEPRAPRQVAPEVPRDLETIILKCLAKEPAQRYATAQALVEDLRACVEARPIKARSPSLWERAARWAHKRERTARIAALSAGTALILVASAVVGWRQYHQAQLGQLQFRVRLQNPEIQGTFGQNLQAEAEVLDEQDKTVVPTFLVPTSKPIELPAGSYKVRFSGSGLLSETRPLEVERWSGADTFWFDLSARWLWPPRELNRAESPETEVVRLTDHADIVELTYVLVNPTNGHREDRVCRLDGRTGQPVWKIALKETNLPPGGDTNEWMSLLKPLPRPLFASKETCLVQPAPDLDGDGTGDLVWLSHTTPSLLAVSGANGRVLWWYRGRPLPPAGTRPADLRGIRSGEGVVVGRAAQADVDDDGKSDLIACFHSKGDTYTNEHGQTLLTGAASWIAAVSGLNGVELWHYELGNRWSGFFSGPEGRRRYNALCRPAVAQVAAGDRSKVVVLADESRLIGLDLRTGQEVWTPRRLDFEPKRAPDLVDLDGDGQTEALIIGQRPEGERNLELVAMSLQDEKEFWRTDVAHVFVSYRQTNARQGAPEDRSYWVTDMETDSRLEIVVVAGIDYVLDNTPRKKKGWLGLQVINGTTGEIRWKRRIAFDKAYAYGEWTYGDWTSSIIEQLTVGPDLNGDGSRELFVASHCYLGWKKNAISVAAISGADGAVLWRTDLDAFGPIGPMSWWHAGIDGWPQLIVPVWYSREERRLTFILNTGSGRVAHTLPDVFESTVADFDGDGLTDLFYAVSWLGASRQCVLKGTSPEPWRSMGQWDAAQDFDGDGNTDLVGVESRPTPPRLLARSGQDGRRLWSNADVFARNYFISLHWFFAPPLPQGDLNGDGRPDLVTSVQTRGTEKHGIVTSGDPHLTLGAISGSDGHRLWVDEEFSFAWKRSVSSSHTNWCYGVPFLYGEEFNGDGHTEILLVEQAKGGLLRLHAWSGKTGQRLWELPIIMGGFVPSPSPQERRFADLNGDSIGDLIVWSPVDLRPTVEPSRRDKTCRLSAYSGRNGQPLWTSAALQLQETNLLWPEPVVGDLDADAVPEALVIFSHDWQGKSQGHTNELVAVDGRTGRVRWSWSWQTESSEIWPPVILKPETNRPPVVCLGIRERETEAVAVLSAQGQVLQRLPLTVGGSGRTNALAAGHFVWRVADVDGDGGDELLLLNDGQLRVYGGANLSLRWQRSLPEAPAWLFSVQAASSNCVGTLGIWAADSVFGLDSVTGETRWRCDAPYKLTLGRQRWLYRPPIMLLASAETPGFPRVLFASSGACYQTLPTEPNGRYRLPSPKPRTFEPLPLEEPRRPWPWRVGTGTTDELIDDIFGIWTFWIWTYSLLVGVIPLALVYWTLKRRTWVAGFVAVLYGGFMALLAKQGVTPVLGLVVSGLLVLWARRDHSWKPVALAALFAVISLAPLLAVILGDTGRPRDTWLWPSGVPPSHPIERVLLGFIPWAYLVMLGQAAKSRRWRQLGWLVGASIGIGLIYAAFLLWVDRGWKHPSEVYLWQEWYRPWIVGVWMTGLVCAIILAESLAKKIRLKRGLGASQPTPAMI